MTAERTGGIVSSFAAAQSVVKVCARSGLLPGAALVSVFAAGNGPTVL